MYMREAWVVNMVVLSRNLLGVLKEIYSKYNCLEPWKDMRCAKAFFVILICSIASVAPSPILNAIGTWRWQSWVFFRSKLGLCLCRPRSKMMDSICDWIMLTHTVKDINHLHQLLKRPCARCSGWSQFRLLACGWLSPKWISVILKVLLTGIYCDFAFLPLRSSISDFSFLMERLCGVLEVVYIMQSAFWSSEGVDDQVLLASSETPWFNARILD
jgi:hypothetical protein